MKSIEHSGSRGEITMSAKKVILFIVEGLSDMHSLSIMLSRLINSKNVQFQIVGGDITSCKESNHSNIIKKLNEVVKKFLERTHFKKQNILEIIHLVDTDGAYVNEFYINEGPVSKFHYSPEAITARSIQEVLERNVKKSALMNRLSTLTKISNLPYSIYYFSCNLDHALHNIYNLDDDLKIEKAYDFSDKYADDLPGFIDFINDASLKVNGTYKETWNFIKLENNSLNRNSNFHLVINKFISK